LLLDGMITDIQSVLRMVGLVYAFIFILLLV